MTPPTKATRALVLACATVAQIAGAADTPPAFSAHPIRLILGYPPGGASDAVARPLAVIVGTRLGQTIVIDNRPGAGGNIAAEIVARSAADGYTLLLGSMGTQSVNVSIYSKLAFDPVKDFAPISLVVNSANLLLVHPSIPASTVKDLIRLAKTKADRFSYSSSGSGSFNHLSAELFNLMAGTRMVHIPYKSGAQTLTAVVSGEADILFQTIPPVQPYLEARRLKALAVGTVRRHPLFPQLLTVSESGLPGFEISTWYGILAPAGTPSAIVAGLSQTLADVVKSPAAGKRLQELGVDPASNTPDQFAALIRADTVKWAKVAKAANIKVN